MKPLVRLVRDAASAMYQRSVLLAKPDEFFVGIFGGRIPTLHEKLLWVEQATLSLTPLETYANDVYSVEVRRPDPYVHLSIVRHDGRQCQNWRELQQIKNEIVGPENEAVELFPAESRLIDTNNEYHLWVHSDPRFRFSLGFFSNRCVTERPLLESDDAPPVLASGE